MKATTRRRIVAGALAAVLVAAGVAMARSQNGGAASAGSTAQPTSAAAPGSSAGSQPRNAPLHLTVHRFGRLPAPVQDAALATAGGTVYAIGGLDANSNSTARVTAISAGGVHAAGTLPLPIHDAAAASAGGRIYVMGGGQVTSEPGIATFSPADGRVRLVGQFPTPLSDLAAVSLGSSVYVVGGFTGSAWSNRIYAVHDGRPQVAASLPVGLRYAAVAVVDGSLLIAGGRTEHGPSRGIYRYTPGTHRVVRVGTLPVALMHASAATIGSVMYVVGGITSEGRPTGAILAIDAQGHVRRAASLPGPLSDAGVASAGKGRLLVVGGNTGAAPTSAILELRLQRQAPKQVRPHKTSTVSALPRMYRGPLPGDLLIADRGNNRLLVINPAGRILWRYPSRPGQPRLNFDDDAFFTPGGHGIISNEEDNNDIVRISYPAGHLVWRYGHPGVPGSGAGYLDTPDDAYMLRSGMVITSDDRNCRIVELQNRRVVRSIGTPGSCVHDPPRSLALPNGDTPIPNGHLLISEINGSWIDEVTLSGHLISSWQAPVTYPSDPQLTQHGNVIVSDYSHPGAVVILARHTGRLLWRYGPSSGPGELDHPSLATMLPNGDIIIGDDYNHRIVIVDPHTRRIVWQYGHLGTSGTRRGYLHTPDGFDFIPVTPTGAPNTGAIRHGP